MKYTDPDGCFAETAWDVLSLAAGVRSFVRNVKSGDVGGAVLDAVGIIADAAAVALPCIPGGAGAAIKAVRATKAVANGVMGTCQVVAGVNNIAEGVQNSDAGQVLDGSIQVISGTMTVAGAMNELEAVSKMPKATNNTTKATNNTIYVTPDGVALPPGKNIPNNYIENPYRSGSYGVMNDGKFQEKLRIDSPTPTGKKGPEFSHFHVDGGKDHLTDLSKWPE